MKTIIISRLCSLFVAILMLSNSFAQKDLALNSIDKYAPGINKNNISSLKSLKDFTNEKVSKKIYKYFRKNFHAANQIQWSQVDKNLLATFVIGEIKTKALFNDNGKIIYTIDLFSEKILPRQIKSQVMKNYGNYSITSATKISEANRKIWVINLAGKRDFTTIAIENGEMEEVENFRKM